MKYSALFNILSRSQRSFKADIEQRESPKEVEGLWFSEHAKRLMEWSSIDRMYPKMNLPVLGRGSGDDLGSSIIEMSIIIVVEHTGVKEFLLPNRNQNFNSKAVVEVIQERQLPSEVSCLVRDLREGQFSITSRTRESEQ